MKRRTGSAAVAVTLGLMGLAGCGHHTTPWDISAPGGFKKVTCVNVVDVHDQLIKLREAPSDDRDLKDGLKAWGFTSASSHKFTTTMAKLRDAEDSCEKQGKLSAPSVSPTPTASASPTATPSATVKPSAEPAEWKTIDLSKKTGVKSDHLANAWNCLRAKKRDVNQCKAELLGYAKHDPRILAVNLAEFNLLPGQSDLNKAAANYSTKLGKLRDDYVKKLADWRLRQKEQPRLAAVLDSLSNLKVVPMSGTYWTVGRDKSGKLVQERVTMDPSRNFALVGTDAMGVKHEVKGDCGGQPSSKTPIPGYTPKTPHKKTPPGKGGGTPPPPNGPPSPPPSSPPGLTPKSGNFHGGGVPTGHVTGSPGGSKHVETSTSGGGGVSDTSTHTKPGSESGLSGQGATPAPNNPQPTQAPATGANDGSGGGTDNPNPFG